MGYTCIYKSFCKGKRKKVTAQIALEILRRAFRQDAFFVPPGKKTTVVYILKNKAHTEGVFSTTSKSRKLIPQYFFLLMRLRHVSSRCLQKEQNNKGQSINVSTYMVILYALQETWFS